VMFYVKSELFFVSWLLCTDYAEKK
jgi:hypothetical protein